MKKGNVANLASKKNEFSVRVNETANTSKKFDPQNAEIITASEEEETIQTETEEKVSVPQLSIEENKEVTTTTQEEKRTVTMQELKEFATIVYLLQQKHTKLIEKRASLDRFAISHNNENATITVEDASGEEFISNSPKTIKRLVEFWKEEFNEAIAEVEGKLKEVFTNAA